MASVSARDQPPPTDSWEVLDPVVDQSPGSSGTALGRERKGSRFGMLTTRQAFWHCMTLVLGLGTLAIPYTLKGLGWMGLAILAVLACISAHTAKLLCRCIDYVPKASGGSKGSVQLLDTYQDIGEAAYGKAGRAFVDFILNVDLIASSALFLVFIANNLGSLFPDVGLTNQGWVTLSALCLLPTVLLKIQKLSFLSAVGSWIMLLLVLTVVYAAIVAAPESLEGNEYHIARFQLQAMGNMVFAFACHGTLLTIYRDMRKPSEAGRLFNQVYLAGYMLKVVVGVTGYYLFAQHTMDQVTLNLPIPWLRHAITLAVTAKKALTYALPLEPVALEAERRWAPALRAGRPGMHAVIVRTFLVALTAMLALCLPYFGLFQSLVGSLCAGFLVLILPLLFYLKLFGTRLSRRERLLNWTLLVFSSVLVLLSSADSLAEARDVMWSGPAAVEPAAVVDAVDPAAFFIES